MNFLDLTLETITDVYNIELSSFKKPWSLQEFTNELNNSAAKYFCLSVDDKIIGYIGVWIILDEGHITNVAVLPEYRGKGYGEMLVKKVISYAGEMNFTFLTLEVRKSNDGAIGLYEKCGFSEVGIRKKYYENTEDAILMTWSKNVF